MVKLILPRQKPDSLGKLLRTWLGRGELIRKNRKNRQRRLGKRERMELRR